MKKLFSKKLLSILLVVTFVLASLLIVSCKSTSNVSTTQISKEDLLVANSDPALNRQKIQNGIVGFAETLKYINY